MEYPQHKKAKLRIGTMFAQSHKVEYEKALPCATEQGERNYIADILLSEIELGPPYLGPAGGLATAHIVKTIIEIDGAEGHSSKRDFEKMKLRDATFRAQGIKTVRLATAWCVGRRALSDADLMKEIEWQIQRQ